jgi:hypothetical protein
VSYISVPHANAQTNGTAAIIPSWIKNNAKYWSQGEIEDSDFTKGIQYLVDQKIMVIPAVQSSGNATSQEIPAWIKINAGGWASGQISEDEFVKGIQYLVSNSIISTSTSGTNSTTSTTTSTSVQPQMTTNEHNNTYYNYTVTLPGGTSGQVQSGTSNETSATNDGGATITIHAYEESSDAIAGYDISNTVDGSIPITEHGGCPKDCTILAGNGTLTETIHDTGKIQTGTDVETCTGSGTFTVPSTFDAALGDNGTATGNFGPQQSFEDNPQFYTVTCPNGYTIQKQFYGLPAGALIDVTTWKEISSTPPPEIPGVTMTGNSVVTISGIISPYK